MRQRAATPAERGITRETLGATAGPGRADAPGHVGHTVQFYEDDTFLAASVGDHLAAGLVAGRPVVVIATPAHRSAFASRLAAAGIDVDRARGAGALTWLDAREMLGTFMRASTPDRERFMASLGRVLEQSRRGDAEVDVCAYGEMVDLLWKDGNADGAIQVEALWNELAATHRFSLLCTYAMHGFDRSGHAPHLEAICRHHTRVVPTERYTGADADARLVRIALLEQRARALETEVERRTALEQRLQEALAEAESARRAAEAASRAKSEFLAVMSHELRTPLNAIGGYAELLGMGLHGPVTTAQAAALERIQRSQRHLLGLINGVLNYARVDAGRLHYELADVPLDELLATCEALTAPQARARGVRVAFDGCDPTLRVRADGEKVQQVILNLLTNALKFTDPRGTVTMSCEASAEGVTVRVSDTGRGIAADQLERVFQPFVQVDAGLTRTREGVGLGLAISRDLARGMGGDLTVESTVGVGSTFSLTLPRA